MSSEGLSEVQIGLCSVCFFVLSFSYILSTFSYVLLLAVRPPWHLVPGVLGPEALETERRGAGALSLFVLLSASLCRLFFACWAPSLSLSLFEAASSQSSESLPVRFRLSLSLSQAPAAREEPVPGSDSGHLLVANASPCGPRGKGARAGPKE